MEQFQTHMIILCGIQNELVTLVLQGPTITAIITTITTTVPLNCNFISTLVISHGTTKILQCIPVTCLHGPHLLVSCNVHVSWKYTHGSTCLMVIHISRKNTLGNTHVEGTCKEQNLHVLTHNNLLIPSLLHYITPIFFWLISTMSRIVSSVSCI